MPGTEIVVGAVLGLVVGSFLNVVVHRLPRMLERQWQRELSQWQAEQASQGHSGVGDARPQQACVTESPAPYDLARPRSHCPACGHLLTWYENLPLVGFALLRGRCSACRQAISWRYPLVELATALLFAWALERWGLTLTGAWWCAFCACLLALALIDADTQYLPDDITLPFVWVGLIGAALGLNPAVGLESAVWGAVAGYLGLWLVYHAFRWATGKEGMGYGDFKLLAALGAWLGGPALLPVVLLASVGGVAAGLGGRLLGRLQAGQPMAFGPFLAAGGLIVLWWGPWALWPV